MKRIMMAIGIFIFVCGVSVCEKSTAREQAGGQWTTYTTTDGLPSNAVGAIALGPDGDLWCVPLLQDDPVGGGVAHFDGSTWKQYTTKDGMGSAFIIWLENALAVSSDGVLWVGTFGGGVSRFDGKTWTNYTSKDGLFSDSVTAVAIAPNGDVWCANQGEGPGGGISHFDGKTWTAYTASDMGVRSGAFMNVAVDPDGTLWAGGDGVVRYDGETWTSLYKETKMGGPPVGTSMDIGPDGKIWFSEGKGVACFDGSAWSHYSFEDMGANGSAEGVSSLAVDSENVLWVGTGGEGVFRYDGKSWNKFAPKDGPDLNETGSIAVGPDGAIWFAAGVNGIARYQPTDGK